jgi:hypothetical protein
MGTKFCSLTRCFSGG